MTNKEKYMQAFGTLHASSEMMEVKMETRKRRKLGRRAIVTGLCLVLVFGLSVAAYANGDKIIKTIKGWQGNFEVSETEDGTSVSILNTDSLVDPVEIKDGKLILVVNDEDRDITSEVSEDKAYIYSYEEDGSKHYLVVGLNGDSLEEYGYAEFIHSDNTWVGGYSARTNINADGEAEAEWLRNAKEEIGVPW